VNGETTIDNGDRRQAPTISETVAEILEAAENRRLEILEALTTDPITTKDEER
jgi:hypothetical protein